MKIHEYQAKEILNRYGILIPPGAVVDNLAAGFELSQKLGFPLAVKAQVRVGGRGKAGAIKIVANLREFEKEFSKILGMEVKGLKVKKVLLEKALEIKQQFYLGVTVDRSQQTNAVLASQEGGIEIEDIAQLYPAKIVKVLLKESSSLKEEEIASLISRLGLSSSLNKPLADTVQSLFEAYLDIDAQLTEINPLVLTKENRLVACDAKIVIDDNALFRHENLKTLQEEATDNELEREANRRNLAYVKLSGRIGIIGNGAGLVMATMDEVKRAGGSPANFLDIGGGAKKDVVQNALEVIYLDREVEGIFINIFGGITRCDEVARGIIQAIEKMPQRIPIVVRLAGTQCEEGQRLLEDKDLISAQTMEEGARKLVDLVNKK